MHQKPIILLSLAPSNPVSYSDAVREAGGCPVGGYLPDLSLIERCSGVLLGGGGDVEPSWYGQENLACDTLDRERDEREWHLIRQAKKRQIPLLGICRGMQFLNVAFGGDLIQDLGTSHSMVQGTYRRHWVENQPGSQIAALYGTQCVVNSGHHQAVRRLAPGFHATQWARDGVIEAIEHRSLPILGVQWHPEQLCQMPMQPEIADGQNLFQWFVNVCTQHQR